MRTLEQKRASHALQFIYQNNQGDTEKLATHINKSPSRILQNGLGQMLVFLLADNAGNEGKDRKPSGKLYDMVQNWLCGEQNENHPARIYNEAPLIDQLVNGSRQDYLRAQEETLALFNWLKKFANASL